MRSAKAGKEHTTPGYRGCGGRRRTESSIEGSIRYRCVEGVVYLLDLELVSLNLALVTFDAWLIRSPPESPLDFACNSGVV